MSLTKAKARPSTTRRGFFRNNSLPLVCFALFAIFVVGVLFTGFREHNVEQKEHEQPELSLGEYATSGAFWEAIFENWESEFLQMASYVVLTVFLLQKGSAESKDPEHRAPIPISTTIHTPTRTSASVCPGPCGEGVHKALPLRELAGAGLRGSLHRVGRRSHAGGGVDAYNSGFFQQTDGQPLVDTLGLRNELAVLVRVVPELAERVPRRLLSIVVLSWCSSANGARQSRSRWPRRTRRRRSRAGSAGTSEPFGRWCPTSESPT